jgi:predicted phage tail protein
MDRLKSAIGRAQFFNDPRAKFLGEAWVASKVASAREAQTVRLLADAFPDFELRLNNAIRRYEITTADKEGRHVGQKITWSRSANQS